MCFRLVFELHLSYFVCNLAANCSACFAVCSDARYSHLSPLIWSSSRMTLPSSPASCTERKCCSSLSATVRQTESPCSIPSHASQLSISSNCKSSACSSPDKEICLPKSPGPSLSNPAITNCSIFQEFGKTDFASLTSLCSSCVSSEELCKSYYMLRAQAETFSRTRNVISTAIIF